MPESGPFLISACLLGIPCRYDGRHTVCPALVRYLMDQAFSFIPICPEQLGGLATPRPPARIVGGDGADVLEGRATVLTAQGEDVSAHFRRGAEAARSLARLAHASVALLKDRSPSCGLITPYCTKGPAGGPGVSAALLARAGLALIAVDPGQPFPNPAFRARRRVHPPRAFAKRP